MADGWRRQGRVVSGCLVMGLALAVVGLGVEGAGGAGSPPYDLSVIVVARAPAAPRVALSYSHRVEEARLRAGIAELGRRCGARVGEVVIEDGRLESGADGVGTGAVFEATELVKGESGALPVGAIARSLPEWEHMRVVFVVEEGFAFGGPRDAEADGIAVRLVNEMEAIEYDVERMSGRGEGAGETVPEEGESAPALPGVVLGAGPGLVLGLVLAERRGREGGGRRGAAGAGKHDGGQG